MDIRVNSRKNHSFARSSFVPLAFPSAAELYDLRAISGRKKKILMNNSWLIRGHSRSQRSETKHIRADSCDSWLKKGNKN